MQKKNKWKIKWTCLELWNYFANQTTFVRDGLTELMRPIRYNTPVQSHSIGHDDVSSSLKETVQAAEKSTLSKIWSVEN